MNDRVNLSMTPLVDVVFLLIIFFLVSGHLARRENRPPLDLPTSGHGEKPDAAARWLTIHLDAEQTYQIGGAVVAPEQIGRRIREHRDRFGDLTAVRLRVDAAVPYGTVAPLLKETIDTGIDQVTLVTTRRSVASRP
jgi:biopolymer transport protein ExbD